jgi:hypothetical protein
MARAVERQPLAVSPGTPPPDARQWLIDNDLWDDDFGMPPELTRVKQRWGDDGSPRRAAD